MIKQFLSKYILEVIPSIVATVVGAYIVTHYINAKPDAGKPPAAISSPAPASTPARDEAAAKAEASAKAAEKAAEAKTAAAAKLAAEKAAAEKAEAARKAERLASEKREAEKRELEKKEAERREAEKREHAFAKATPAAKAPDVKPVVESAATPDANDLARAAIARLRAEQPKPLPAAAAVKMPEHPVAPVVAAPASQPVAAPAVPPMREATIVPTEPTPPAAVTPLPTASIDTAPPIADVNASRLVPPADIPSRPLDLQARDDSKKDSSSVVSDVMSATKSAFEAVLPH